MLRYGAGLVKCFWGIVLGVGTGYFIYVVFGGVALALR